MTEKKEETKSKNHIIDASGKRLGRLASEIALLLRGKNRADFVPYLDKGDPVTVINTDKIEVSGQKAKQKVYHHYSGYPGGMKTTTYEELFERDSREVLKRAVWGMLPKNKLRDKMIKKLKLYKGEKT